MPIRVSAGITTIGIAHQIINYCAAVNPAVCIGGGLPWLYPDVPPPPDIFIRQVTAAIGYFAVIRRVPIIKDISGDIAVSADEAWQTLPLDAELLANKGCRHVLIESRISHNLLPNSVINYQSCGLYLNCSNLPLTGFNAGEPDGYLDFLQQFGVIEKTSNAIHIIRMVRKF